MGVNEVNDGIQSHIAQRVDNLRRVKRQENDPDSPGGQKFQQVFEFSKKEEEEEEHKNGSHAEPANPPEILHPVAPPRVLSPEDNESAKKRDELEPGQLIDVEA